MYFEVFIPGVGPSGFDTRLQVQATSWLRAVDASAKHGGTTLSSLAGAYVSLKGGGSTELTLADSRAPIKVRVIDALDSATAKVLDARSNSEPSPVRSGRTAQASGQVTFRDNSGQHRTLTPASVTTVAEDDPGAGHVITETRRKSEPLDTLSDDFAGAGDSYVSDSPLEDVFLEIPSLFEDQLEIADAIDFVIDLARRYVPSAHLGLLFPDKASTHLYFAAARGKGSKQMLAAKLPIDDSLISHCHTTGLAVAVADAVNDPRYSPAFTEQTGLRIENLACAPIAKGQRVYGVLFAGNRGYADEFSDLDINVLSYIGTQMGTYLQPKFESGS